MINTVIIDDDRNNREKLHQLLIRHCPEIEVTGMAENMEQARKVILETAPELVFLTRNFRRAMLLNLSGACCRLSLK